MSLDEFLLPKDTKVFILYEKTTIGGATNSQRLYKTQTSFKEYGFKCTLQPLPSTKEILESPYESLGVKPLPLPSKGWLKTSQIKEWYGFFSILKKARILQRPYIITFPDNVLVGNLHRLSDEKMQGMFRFPSSKDTPDICKNYIISPSGGVELIKETKKINRVVALDLHEYLRASQHCVTLNSNFKYA